MHEEKRQPNKPCLSWSVEMSDSWTVFQHPLCGLLQNVYLWAIKCACSLIWGMHAVPGQVAPSTWKQEVASQHDSFLPTLPAYKRTHSQCLGRRLGTPCYQLPDTCWKSKAILQSCPTSQFVPSLPAFKCHIQFPVVTYMSVLSLSAKSFGQGSLARLEICKGRKNSCPLLLLQISRGY